MRPLTFRYSQYVPGGIAKAFGLDDGPTHRQVALAKGRALDDATQTRSLNQAGTKNLGRCQQVWPCRPARAGRQSLVIACVGWMLLIGSCQKSVPTSSSQGQTTRADHPELAATQSSKPPAQAPLLLEDEPASGASSEPAADNSRCFVCHANYMQEQIAVTHAKANMGCAHCHGASDAHIADESWASGGNGTAPDRMYPRDKINPSCMTCHPKDKIDTPQHLAVLADTEGKTVCTNCHGTHRLPQRRCKWR